MLTDKEAILQRWSEHFEGLFSDCCTELDDPPTHEEIKKATTQLKKGKLPGIDGMPAEVYRYRGRGKSIAG